MAPASPTVGRRERNKQAKLERIVAAAGELFAARGVDDVTTQEIAAAATASGALDGVIALLAPIVECNRVHVDNGRTYLREMLFGDAAEPHHAEALRFVAETEQSLTDLLVARAGRTGDEARIGARLISAAMFVAMASAASPDITVPTIVADVRAQAAVVLGE